MSEEAAGSRRRGSRQRGTRPPSAHRRTPAGGRAALLVLAATLALLAGSGSGAEPLAAESCGEMGTELCAVHEVCLLVVLRIAAWGCFVDFDYHPPRAVRSGGG